METLLNIQRPQYFSQHFFIAANVVLVFLVYFYFHKSIFIRALSFSVPDEFKVHIAVLYSCSHRATRWFTALSFFAQLKLSTRQLLLSLSYFPGNCHSTVVDYFKSSV